MLTILAATVSALCGLAVQPEPPPRPNLTGHIQHADGSPVKDATVYLYTATVKHGYSTMCPSCWLDCGKHATSDSSGSFKIESLDPELIFRVLAVAEGHEPTFATKIDPAGGPVTITLPTREPEPADSRRVVRGRVLDGTGAPVSGAIISPEFVWWTGADGKPSGSGGQVKGLDPIAATNTKGEFVVCYKDPADAIVVGVEARGWTTTKLRLATGSDLHVIKMREGATIRGRLVHNGQPVPHVQMTLDHSDHLGGNYLGRQNIGTRDDGTFEFDNVPVDYVWMVVSSTAPGPAHPAQWNLVATMDSIKALGCTPPKAIAPRKDGELLNIGDIEIRPGLRLSGRVILTDGKPFHPGDHIAVGLKDGWDAQDVLLDERGNFTAQNVPAGGVYLSPSIQHYRLSRSNLNLGWSIEGRLESDMEDFIILLDPGDEDFQGLAGGKHDHEPLRSASAPHQ